MRDIALTLMVLASLPYIFKRPYIGVLVWAWLSYMNPHRLTYGFAYSLPFAQIVAIATLLSLLMSKEAKKIQLNSTVIIWLCYLAWMGISTLYALHPNLASSMYSQILKIQLVALLTLMVMTDLERITQLVWVIVISIGFYSVKGGIFTLTTGGMHHVWGPAGSFIEENNALALASLMVIPLMIYLYQVTEKKWLRYALGFAVAISMLSVLGSQSRGALLSIIAVSFLFWLKSGNKLVTGALLLVFAVAGYAFMPQSWHDRMNTISTYQEDGSAMGRINAWHYNFNVANDRISGGGLRSESADTFAIYAPNPANVHSAHSIYFGVLGDHGWIGFILFMLIIFKTWRSLSRTIKLTEGTPDNRKINRLARMLQVSLVAYLSGGAFLSLAYFDLPWHIVAVALLLSQQLASAQSELPEIDGIAAPRERRSYRPMGSSTRRL